MAQSKTARASMRAGTRKAGAFERPAGALRLIPLAQGTRCYLFNDAGHTETHKVGTDEFVAALAKLLEGREAGQVTDQVNALDAQFPAAGWAASLAAASAPAADTDAELAAAA